MKRKNIVSIRLTDEEYINLQMKAKAVDKSMSEYVRELISMNKVKISRAKKVDREVLYLLNRMSNNINQIAKNLNIARNKSELDRQNYELLLSQLYEINENMKKILNECKQ